MLIVALAFAVVFICRDVQVLTTADGKAPGARFALYAALILAAAAVVTGLPCPAFLAVLFALSFAIQDALVRLSAIAAAEIVTVCWLGIVGALALFLFREEESADRQFVDDFALMTSCTALIFVPYGIF